MEGGIYQAPCTGISADVMCIYVHNALTIWPRVHLTLAMDRHAVNALVDPKTCMIMQHRRLFHVLFLFLRLLRQMW